MASEPQPYHAHIYFEPGERALASRLHLRLSESRRSGEPALLFVGQWIGAPLPLDLSVRDPPGMDKGVTRFGQSDF